MDGISCSLAPASFDATYSTRSCESHVGGEISSHQSIVQKGKTQQTAQVSLPARTNVLAFGYHRRLSYEQGPKRRFTVILANALIEPRSAKGNRKFVYIHDLAALPLKREISPLDNPKEK
jgi:hypothetical protein